MASSSSDPNFKHEFSSGGGGGGEVSETVMANDQLLLYRGLKKAKKERGCTAKERISKMPPCAAGKRSSIYRGVTRHRWTGRYEAHLWDKSTWNANQNKKGKQVYLGAYDDEEAAARAYDLAALKYWGPGTLINFPVTDYTRDLEEMQNVSREDYLASLRRKSSGFSRGISKYRAISSRWDPSFRHVAGPDYFKSIHYGTGDDSTKDNDYVSGFCIERKIDLTNYIKWWAPNKTRQSEPVSKSSEEAKNGCAEDFGCELKTLEWAAQTSEPYQMPRLGLAHDGKKRKKNSSLSALSILSRSSAYKSMLEKASKNKEPIIENDDEIENKNNINKMEYGMKAVEKSDFHGGGNLPIESNVYPPLTTHFLSPPPLLTNYSSIEPLADSVLWPSMVPGPPTGLSRTTEVAKTETSSTYTFFQQDE